MLKLKTQALLSLLFLTISSGAQTRVPFIKSLEYPNKWVDSVFRKLNKKERIAQLLMVRAHTNKGKAYEDSVAEVIKKQRVGGLVFFQGGPARQAALTNYYQSLSHIPLLIAMDGEWGLGMRLDSAVSYPFQMTLGALKDTPLVYETGREVAKDFRRLGMHVNFAPVVDINNNPANPVINYRSFGDNKYNVAAKAWAYTKGMQDEGLLVSLKHFPGHGDTDVDSHLALPQLKFDRNRLDSLEMYPFRELIKKGASGVMVAHMNIPALDRTENLPSTLSKPIITGILKTELAFKGLVFTDAMEMKGVVKFFPEGEADIRALAAGNDVLELSENSARAIKLIRKAVKKKRISKDQINASVKKVLAAKYWAGLNNFQPVDTANVAGFLNRPETFALKQRLAAAAVTVLNSDSLLKALDLNKKTAVISLGVTRVSSFQEDMKLKFPNSTNFILSKIAGSLDIAGMLKELKGYEQIIMAIHDYRKRPLSTLDYNNELKLFIAEAARLNTVTVLFANPYTIAGLPGIEQSKTLIVNYQNTEEMYKASVNVLTGRAGTNGRLPVTVNSFFKTGDGIEFFPEPKQVSGQVE